MTEILKKIFAPINRWNFAFFIFFFWLLARLYTHFLMFFDLYNASLPYFVCVWFIIILFLIFKRFFDIFGKLLKTTIFTIISAILLIFAFFISISAEMATINANKTLMENNPTFLLLYSVCFIILVLFLCLKNGTNSKFFHFEKKLTIKRIILIIFLYSIFKFLHVSYIALPNIHDKMYPTFEAGDRLLINTRKNTSLERGDIVFIKNNNTLEPLRILGLPNEEIKLNYNNIYINKTLYQDKFAFYSKNLKPINFQKTIKLDKNSYFVIGDNRYYDKRGKLRIKGKNGGEIWRDISDNCKNYAYLTVSRDEILGKIIAIHYENYKFYNTPNKKISRNNIGYAFTKKHKKFEFNSSSLHEYWYGKP